MPLWTCPYPALEIRVILCKKAVLRHGLNDLLPVSQGHCLPDAPVALGVSIIIKEQVFTLNNMTNRCLQNPKATRIVAVCHIFSFLMVHWKYLCNHLCSYLLPMQSKLFHNRAKLSNTRAPIIRRLSYKVPFIRMKMRWTLRTKKV